jgi:hypothetical protein
VNDGIANKVRELFPQAKKILHDGSTQMTSRKMTIVMSGEITLKELNQLSEITGTDSIVIEACSARDELEPNKVYTTIFVNPVRLARV